MTKLIIFLILIGAAIFFVWPTAPQGGFSKEDLSIKKEGFEKFKEDTNREFNEFKSKN